MCAWPRLALIVKAYEHYIMPSHFFIDGSPLNEERKDFIINETCPGKISQDTFLILIWFR